MPKRVQKNKLDAWLRLLTCQRQEDGFTIFEVLVSLSIFSVVMIAMLSFLLGTSRNWQSSQDSVDAIDNARLGLNRMTRELRQSSEITLAEADHVEFTVDFGNGPETVSYSFSPGDGGSGSVIRTSYASGGEAVLMDNVISLHFEYYGSDYRCDPDNNGLVTLDELSACSEMPLAKIARVDISLTMDSGDVTKDFFGQAWLRNHITD